jgi:hypothetical protein
VEVDEMVGKVIRAVQAPISVSIGLARTGAALAGRVAGWAVTGIVRELSPDNREEEPVSAATASPRSEAVTAVWEPEEAQEEVAAADESKRGPEVEEERVSPPSEERVPPTEDDRETAPSAGAATDAAPVGAEEASLVGSEESEPALPEEEKAPPVDSEESERALPEEEKAPPVGGEGGAVVEHEPGVGTSVRAPGPHSALNNPISEADMTEWPDPYDHREDPRDPGEEMVFGDDAGHTQTGATSTSEPHPSHDPEAEPWEGPKRDKVDQ